MDQSVVGRCVGHFTHSLTKPKKVVIGVQLENRAAFTEEALDGILSTNGKFVIW